MPFSCVSSETSIEPVIHRDFKDGNVYRKLRKLLRVPQYIRTRLKEYKKFFNKNNSHDQLNVSNYSFDTTSFNVVDQDSYRKKSVKQIKCDKSNMCDIISRLYCSDIENQLYEMIFKTSNVRIVPIRLKERKIPDFNTDKQTQSNTKVKFKETCNINSGHFWMTKRIFILLKNPRRSDECHDFRKVDPLRVYYSDELLEKFEKRREKRSQGKTKTIPIPIGQLYLVFNDIIFSVKCKILHLDPVKNKAVERTGKRQSVANVAQFLNRATIVAKYNDDVLQFNFDICQATVQPIVLQKNKGCQVIDRYSFLPYTSVVSNRPAFIPLPLANFYYTDPMKKWKNLNRFNALRKINPHWMKEVRRRRKKGISCIDLEDGLAKEDVSSSLVIIETGGTVFKIRGGVVKVKNIINSLKYEEFVIKRQKDRISKKWEKSQNKKGAIVSDWNLETHDM